MNFSQMQDYILPLVVVLFFGWKYFNTQKNKKLIPDFMKRGAVILDVRTKEEYSRGAHPKSLNIPLDSLKERSKDLDLNRPIILCCASGTRSGMAMGLLKKQGFSDLLNAGSWTNTLDA